MIEIIATSDESEQKVNDLLVGLSHSWKTADGETKYIEEDLQTFYSRAFVERMVREGKR